MNSDENSRTSRMSLTTSDDSRSTTTISENKMEENNKTSIYQKCQVCSKKVLPHGKCKCSNFYCGKHLHQHECSFSHFLHNKMILEKKSIKIESDKLIRL